MPAPFYNNIKGTSSGAAGTGAFTPTTPPTGYRAWSNAPPGWWGLVRYDDTGGAWELTYSYWNGTTLSRASTQFFDSLSGSPLTLTSSATAALVLDGNSISPALGSMGLAIWAAQANSTSASSLGIGSIQVTGTTSAAAIANTNALTRQRREQIASATTANAQAGVTSIVVQSIVSTTAGMGGFEFFTRLGASGLPTGPRLFAGMTSVTMVANTGEPSALTANVAAFGYDSTDTNFQFMTNSNAGGCTKIDTGIPITVVNGWYEIRVWADPGSNTIWGLLIRVDTGAIWLGSTSTDVPVDGALLFPQVIGGLSATTGTAYALHFGWMTVRNGF